MNYKEILDIRKISDDARRGYIFEQTIRELLPWDIKPPVSVIGDSEQIDAFFIWNNQAFLVEAKAKKGEIKAGGHDWEDFELKIMKRNKNVTGLFCSLYPINKNIHEQAKQLVKQGYLVFIFEGDFWDNLANSCLSVSDILDYMNYYGRAKFLAIPPELSIIENWRYNKDATTKKLSSICLKNSSIFLGRHKSPYHDKIYVKREIENLIDSFVKELKPKALAKEKEEPCQICILRDFSGSGKTTTSIHISLKNDAYFGVGMTANEKDIDQKLINFFDSLGQDYGIGKLKALNTPIIYVIDSLDEAFGFSGKEKEIRSILDKIKILNDKAKEFGLLVYPILLLFTVREDYWRDWESLFEGRRKHVICKRISYFTDGNFSEALTKYMDCYGYQITNELTSESIEVLSRPINMLIFSETNQYAGQIEVHEIWESSVIYKYFERKLDDISRRNIPNYRATVFFTLLSDIAYDIVSTKQTFIEEDKIITIVKKNYTTYYPFCEEILKVFLSEHILVKDIGEKNIYRFRHLRFLEFLIAYYCLHRVRKDIDLLDDLLKTIFYSKVVLMFHIHDDMIYICKQMFPNFVQRLDNYYSKNERYISRKLSVMRCNLATSTSIKDDDISLILKNINRRNPELLTEAFYVIASKPCKQSPKTIINIFSLAFKSGHNIYEQYKMILKIAANNLICEEKVLGCILHSNYPRNWETYLGEIINKMKGDYCSFIDLWEQANGDRIIAQKVTQFHSEDWSQVKKLLYIIKSGEEFIPGDISF